MKISEIPMGTKLELEVFDSFGEKLPPVFVSEMEWLEEDMTVYIAAPIYEGTIYPIPIGSRMNVYFFSKASLFKFSAVLTARDTQDNIALLQIKATGAIERIQRRGFYRFEWSIPIRFRIIDAVQDEGNPRIPFRETLTRDVSGSGICMLLEEKLNNNVLVECELTLEDRNKIKFYGKIIRVSRLDTEGKFKYEAGLLYKKIENRDREAIIASIFKEQRKLRKKGLI